MIGQDVGVDEATRILTPLGFGLTTGDAIWTVRVPSFRATNDISIEADVIEEIARYVGYGTIEPALPRITARRFEPHALHELEQRTLDYFTTAHCFREVQGYLWYDARWLERLGIEPGPGVELRNPAADGLHQLKRTLLPNLLASVARNRFYFPAFSIIEVGSVFERGEPHDHEYRHVGLVSAQRGKEAEEELHGRLKGAIERWAWQRFGVPVAFAPVEADSRRPWEHPHRTAAVLVNGADAGRNSVIDLPLRRAMDDHLSSWSIAWAELRLNGLEDVAPRPETLGVIPEYPLVEMDFSFLVSAATRYAEVLEKLVAFKHPLLKSIRYVGSYQGKSIAVHRRSLTFRMVVGDDARTLVDADANDFRRDFERYLADCGYETRR